MPRAVSAVAAAILLAGSTVLAFYSGGYFAQPRLIAAIVAWALVLAVTAIGPAPLPRSVPGGLAVGGLAFLAAWSALSVSWAPLAGAAMENVQRLVLYVGALLVAIGVLRTRRLLRAVEPALAAGASVVICYGLSGRLLPGIVHLDTSGRAGGRLDQPITYWNAEGVLAAVGFVLCARLAGDRTRPTLVRALAAAAAAPLGAGTYLSYSRGAIAAAVLGLVILVAAAPVRAQLRAALVAVTTGAAAAACSSAFPGVASLSGEPGARERDGAVMLAVLILLALGGGLLVARRARRDRSGLVRHETLPGVRWRRVGPAVAVVLVMAGLAYGGLTERAGDDAEAGAKATRLISATSNRYEYWRVGLRAFARHPVEGLGSGGFRVVWLRERPTGESVRDVHSLELEMATELGLVGMLAFGIMILGVALAARRALRRDRVTSAGWCAAAVVWLAHASIDWDWQLPAVTLPFIVLAGALIALAEAPPDVVAPARGAPWRSTRCVP